MNNDLMLTMYVTPMEGDAINDMLKKPAGELKEQFFFISSLMMLPMPHIPSLKPGWILFEREFELFVANGVTFAASFRICSAQSSGLVDPRQCSGENALITASIAIMDIHGNTITSCQIKPEVSGLNLIAPDFNGRRIMFNVLTKCDWKHRNDVVERLGRQGFWVEHDYLISLKDCGSNTVTVVCSGCVNSVSTATPESLIRLGWSDLQKFSNSSWTGLCPYCAEIPVRFIDTSSGCYTPKLPGILDPRTVIRKRGCKIQQRRFDSMVAGMKENFGKPV